MLVTYGYSREDEHFRPCVDIDASNEAWVDIDVDLPKYMDKDCFVANIRKITFMKHFGLNFKHKELTKESFQRLLTLSGFDLYCAVKVLCTRQRCGVRTTVKAQLIDWMYGRSKYFRPWTRKQELVLERLWHNEYRGRIHSIQTNYQPITSFA